LKVCREERGRGEGAYEEAHVFEIRWNGHGHVYCMPEDVVVGYVM
jgi:hypothetical protein